MKSIIDGHIHVTPALVPYLRDVRCIANADSPEEYDFLTHTQLPGMVISAGIHPWKADCTSWDAMEPILRQVSVIGEIGLDNVWCTVDLGVQRTVFERQLAFAQQLGKPVILHTKGMEREILDTIRRYPNRYLVHWYACPHWLQDYIDLGCWFTVGPDAALDRDVAHLAQTVPLDRLLIESDGLDGIAWGQHATLTPADYPAAMERHLHTIAVLRGLTAEALLSVLMHNLDTFLLGI